MIMLRFVNDSVSTLWTEEKIKTVSFLLPGVTFEPKVSSDLIKSS